MLLKTLADCEYVVQESNQIVKFIGDYTLIQPLNDNTFNVYGNNKVVNVYPRTDGVYGVMFELEG